MNEIKIPKSFMLMGQTIKVVMKDDLSFKNDNWGEAKYRENEIRIQANVPGHARNKDQIEETYLHERTHFILSALCKGELNDDEEFVAQFSGLLHQALKTADYGQTCEDLLVERITELKQQVMDLEDMQATNQKIIKGLNQDIKHWKEEVALTERAGINPNTDG